MSKQRCSSEILLRAVGEDWQSFNETKRAALESHLSHCDTCRAELESIAGHPEFWQTATSVLSSFTIEQPLNEGPPSVEVSVDPRYEMAATVPSSTSSSDSSVESHVSRTLLDAPTHPEMLGRIDGFSVEQLIGRGGMGVVFKGFDSELNRPVAIKFLAPQLAASGVARQRFAREAQAAAAVMHPNVVPIHSVNSSPIRPYIVMAFVPGRSLQKHVEQQGPLGVKDIVRIGQQIAAGLTSAHQQGLVHRDIKPANVLLEHDVSRAMITDFGLARAADDAALTQTGWLAGTPHYMSPEQAGGDDIDGRSDLFSLGSVMYFMATGREPFRAQRSLAVLNKIANDQPTSLRSINNDVPKTLEAIISKLLAKQPDKRFESARDVQEVLTQYLAYLQDSKTHKKPIVNDKQINVKRGLVMGSAVLLLSVLLGWGGSKCVSYLMQPKKRKQSVRQTSFANQTHAHSSSEYYGRASNQEVPATGSFVVEMNKLKKRISAMEVRLGGRSN